MKGELSGVGPVFAGVADPIGSGFVASLARRGGRRCRPRSFVALEPDVILSQTTPQPCCRRMLDGFCRSSKIFIGPT